MAGRDRRGGTLTEAAQGGLKYGGDAKGETL
jgi:hypothetical protein